MNDIKLTYGNILIEWKETNEGALHLPDELKSQIDAEGEFNPLLALAKIQYGGGQSYASAGGFDEWETL